MYIAYQVSTVFPFIRSIIIQNSLPFIKTTFPQQNKKKIPL